MREVRIRGAAMTEFGRHASRAARDLVEEVVAQALRDAGLGPQHVQAAYVGNAVAGLISGQESMRAQTVLRRTGLMGLPMVSVENAGASGGTALHLAWQAIAYGIHDCVVALGYEKLDHDDPAKLLRAANAGLDQAELSDIFGEQGGEPKNAMVQIGGAVSQGDGRDLFETGTLA